MDLLSPITLTKSIGVYINFSMTVVGEAAVKPLKVLFVCFANLCRSPMAEVIAETLYAGRIEARSAGVSPAPGGPFEEAVAVVRRRYGVDISSHRPRHVLELPVQDFDFVIALDSGVFLRLTEMARIPKDRLYGWEVPDPCGLGHDAYERTAQTIESALEKFLLNREQERTLPRRRP